MQPARVPLSSPSIVRKRLRATRQALDCEGQIVCADNLAFTESLPDGCCDLIYIDPPFNSGKNHTVAAGGLRVRDVWSGDIDVYMAFLTPRLGQMYRLLADTGTMYVHLDWHAVHYVKVYLDGLFGAGNFLNEVVWSYRTGGLSKQWFARKHDTILVYAKRKGMHRFNVLRQGEFRTDGMNYDDAGRPYKKTKKGRLYFHREGPALTDVWDIPFLSTVSSERVGYPTQKPEALLDRIVRASSNPGDLLADFFCGSGTTLVVARRLGRRFVGCDVSRGAVRIAQQRLAGIGRP